MAKFRFSLTWGNRHVPCPGPEVLLTVETDSSSAPAELLEVWKPGTGYVVRCQPLEHRAPRRWSREAKARVRRLNLQRRLERKVPLFADLFYAQQLAANPAYYAAEDAE